MSGQPSGPTSPSGSQCSDLLSTEERSGVLLLTVTVSQIDDRNADRLGREMDRVTAGRPQPQVVLDLNRVEYLSSAALGVFIAYRQKLDREGGKLRLCGLQPNIAQVFRLTKLDRAFDIRPDLESALGGF